MSNVKNSEFQFSNPELTDLTFHINDSFNMPDSVNVPQRLTANMFADGDKSAIVKMTLRIGDETEEMPFYIEISMQSSFIWQDSIDFEKAKALIHNNGVAMLISYARPIIASITNSSRFPAYNLPFLAVRNFKNDEDDN